jgi:hemerythrin
MEDWTMSIFGEWMETKLTLGLPEIDQQHKELFKRMDTLLEAMKAGKGCDEIIPLIQFLEDYVVVHFETEQKHMTQYKYPGLFEHQREHDEFVQKYLEAKRSFKQDGSCSAWVIRFQYLLRDWIKKHIAEQDMAMGKYLKEKMESEK